MARIGGRMKLGITKHLESLGVATPSPSSVRKSKKSSLQDMSPTLALLKKMKKLKSSKNVEQKVFFSPDFVGKMLHSSIFFFLFIEKEKVLR